MSAKAPLLELRAVTKAFGSNLANDGVDLVLERGEVLGVLGQDGAGKSTLMKILYGLCAADRGQILLDGEAVEIRSPRDAVELGIGMVHEHVVLVPTLSVTENVVLGAEPGAIRFDRRSARRAVRRLAERSGLHVDPRACVRDLSIGMQQRVEILKALYREARILILDEPTAVLTPQETQELIRVLRSLVDAGVSIILISHTPGELLGGADRITVLRDGRVIDTVPAEGTTEAQLARLMVGRDVDLRPRRGATQGALRLEVRGLVVNAAGDAGVLGIDLTVRAGEILAVAGSDGNGQVALAEALAGIRAAKAGAVLIDGLEVTRLGATDRRERGVAYIPQDRSHRGLVRDFTAAENLALKTYRDQPFSHRGWLSLRALRRWAAERMQAVEVRPPNLDVRAGSLSAGNQLKVVAARELASSPKVLIAAQPTRGVDVDASEFLHAQLLEQRDRGTAILLLSLELDEIHALADRVVVLVAGRLVGEVAADQATDEQLGLWMANRTLEEVGAGDAGPRPW